jgi:hypothetical protein
MNQCLLPPFVFEIDLLFDVEIPSPAGHKEIPEVYASNSPDEVFKENYIRICVTQEPMASQILGLREDVVKQRGAEFVLIDVRDVKGVEVTRRACRALLIPEEQDFSIRIVVPPTPESISLDQPDMSLEGFWYCENGQHLCTPLVRRWFSRDLEKYCAHPNFVLPRGYVV